MGFVTEADQLTPASSCELGCQCPALPGDYSQARQRVWQKGLGTSPRTCALGSHSTGTMVPASVSPSLRWDMSTHHHPCIRLCCCLGEALQSLNHARAEHRHKQD